MSKLPKAVRDHLRKLGARGGAAKSPAKAKAGRSNLEKAREALKKAREDAGDARP